MSRVEFPPHNIETLNRFTKTDPFAEIYAQAAGYALQPLTAASVADMRRDMAGALFEEYAYDTLARQGGLAQLASPRDSFLFCLQEVVRRRMPNEGASTHPFGRQNLRNIFTPDGILVENGRATAVEYTTSAKPEYFRYKTREFDGFRRYAGDNALLTFVVLDGVKVPADVLAHDFVTKPLALPVDGTQFHDFTNWVWNKYRTTSALGEEDEEVEESATLAEMQEEAHRQMNRAQRLAASAQAKMLTYSSEGTVLDVEDFLSNIGFTPEMHAYHARFSPQN